MSGAHTPAELVIEADGGSRGNPGPAGYGAVVRDGTTGEVLAERAEFLGVTTNNVAEYRGLIAGLQAAAAINSDAQIVARLDSKLVVEQMSGRWKIKHPEMQKLAREARAILPAANVSFTWIPRAENAAADSLANQAMDGGVGTHISNDYGAEPALPPAAEPGLPASESTVIVLIRNGGAPVDRLRSLGSGAWADLPAPAWVVSAPAERAKETAREIAAGLAVPTHARSLEPALERPTGVSAALKQLAAQHAGATVVVSTQQSAIVAAVGSALEIPESRRESLRVPRGSLTILRYVPDGAVELIAFAVPA